MKTQKPLSGPWHVRHDPGDEGVRSRWWLLPPEDGWVVMDPVGPWQRVLGMEATGVAWYRRRLPRMKRGFLDAGGRVWVTFESVATECTAWVGGVEVGRHIGDYAPFEFDVTPGLFETDEPAEMFVRVDQHHAPRPAPGVLTENGHLTKGFHDVLSQQHGGIWGPVYLRKTGDWSIPADGVWVDANPVDGSVRVHVDVRGGRGPAELVACIERAEDPPGGRRETVWNTEEGRAALDAECTGVELTLRVAQPRLWSVRAPSLYSLVIEIVKADERLAGGRRVSDRAIRTFGFRDVRAGGPDKRRILINGEPTLIRGVLEWGHEPRHVSPSPTVEECRERLRELKRRGFNCVCCCMVYMPRHFYGAADAEGMLVWQEHPVWKSRMGPEHNAEYRRQFEAFFRRDAGHPSVVIVSGSCEHESFDKDLAAWWWERAAEFLPRTLKQVQTAFFAWADPAQTDLYDEHTYDNSGRWVEYVRDVRAAIDALPDRRKPFVMGETILSNAWPSPGAMRAAGRPAWWRTRGLAECAGVEAWIRATHGGDALRRFRRQAHAHALEIRTFQSEVLRMDAANAGWVMNHIRDVPACRCGFIDEMGRWRYSAEELGAFLGDAALVLSTPGEVRGFAAGSEIEARVGLSNFGEADVEAQVALSVLGEERPIRASRGEVGWAGGEPLRLVLPRCERPVPVSVGARVAGVAHNAWRLWSIPDDTPEGCAWADVPEFTGEERGPSFEERGYSSGWGLPVRSWSARLPERAQILPGVGLVAGPRAAGGRVLISHRLTGDLLAWIDAGGSLLLLASHACGGFRARVVMQWGLSPFVAESGPFGAGDSEWLVELLHHDLTKRYQRAVPTEELGLAESVTPLVRYYWTHDSGSPRVLDAVFAARVGSGVLAVSSLDHGGAAGRYLVSRVVRWLAAGEWNAAERVDPGLVRQLTFEADGARGG